MISSTSCLFPRLPSSVEALVIFHCITTETWWLASLVSLFSPSPNVSSPGCTKLIFSKTQIRTGYPSLYSLKNFLCFPLSPKFFLTVWPQPPFHHYLPPDPAYTQRMQPEANLTRYTHHAIGEMWGK